MNVERMNKVADVIQANPEHFDMSFWVRTLPTASPDSGVLLDEQSQRAVTTDLLACGTTGCIGGWACNLWGAEVDPTRSIPENAERILGLSTSQADVLFTKFALTTSDKAADHLRRMALDYEAEHA